MTITVTLEEDPATGDLILPIPDDLMDQMGWQIGDTLSWDVTNDKITIKKITGEDNGEF
jgi:antitoxin component of MazEF toxin-antitoxin module